MLVCDPDGGLFVLFIHRCKWQRLLALPLACWALSGHAQQRLTADEAVTLALSQEPVRQELKAHANSARSEVLSARIWPNPELVVSRERADNGSVVGTRETSALLSQEFELGGRRQLRVDAAELGVRTAEVTAAYELARLRVDVLRAYSDAVSAERLKLAQMRAAAGLLELAGVAATRHRAGDLSGYESRRLAQAGRQSRVRAGQADTAAQAARARLSGWIGNVALTAELDPTPPLPLIPPQRDEPRSAELDVLQARRDQALAQARAESRLALPITIGVGSKRVNEAGIRDDILIIELGVPLPLFDRNQAGRARSAAEALRAEAQYQHALMQTRSRRAAALVEARQLSASARDLFETAVPEAAQLTDIARASFAEGELDLVALLDAHQAEADVIQQAVELQSRAFAALLELQLLAPPAIPSTDPSQY